MKKVLSVLLAVCILASAFSLNAFASATYDEITSCYDFNSDGNVNLSDARMVLRVSAGLEEPKEGYIYDFDGDGFTTISDVTIVLSIVLGIDVEITNPEFLLALFKSELNNVKSVRPGFTKVATTQCESMIVSTKNAPDKSLNVTNMPFDQYTNKSCDYLEGYLFLLIADQKAYQEAKANIAAMRKQANELYNPKSVTTTVAKRRSHYAAFPVNNLANSCFLKIEDIESIECYEEDGYIVRKVKIKEETFIGDEYPTGYENAASRRELVAHGRVFNIPELSEKEGDKDTSILNSIKFRNGVIISKVDKLSGVPVSVDYSYTYEADISTIPEIDKNGNPGLQMDSVTVAHISENFVINPVPAN